MSALLGYHPDTVDSRDWRFFESRIALSAPLTSADLVDHRLVDTPPRNQIYQSCVGHAFAGAASLTMAVAGTPIAYPSALFGYTGARILAEPPDGLVDLGSRPRLAMTWYRDRGLVSDDRWPESAYNVNAIPPLDVWEMGDCAKVTEFYRIEEGSGASDLVSVALRRGYCPVFAMQVDTKYQQIGRNVYDSPGGTVLGGHMQCVVGEIGPLDVFIIRNSWGTGWGDAGYAYISRVAFQRMARDIWVITTTPQVF